MSALTLSLMVQKDKLDKQPFVFIILIKMFFFSIKHSGLTRKKYLKGYDTISQKSYKTRMGQNRSAFEMGLC